MSQTSSPFMRALAAGIRANVPTLIWGGPGQAKTATMTEAASVWGLHLETIIGSTREATDFLGVMVENKGVVSYSSFGWVNRLNASKKGGLLFLDEFNTAGPATMKGMLRVTQERQVGEQYLNDNVSIVAAANPTDIAVDGYDLPAPMANRFMHLDWVFDSKNWLDNVTTGFDKTPTVEPLNRILSADPATRRAVVGGAVTAFLRAKSNLLTPVVPEDAVQAGRAWPSPRSWANVISVLSHLDADDTPAALLVVQGLVGEGAAKEYFAWVSQQDLHDPLEVMNNPAIVNWKQTRPDRLFALIQSITALGLTDEKNWRPAAKVLTACANGGKPDVAAPGAQRLANALPADQKMPQPFLDAFTDLFTKTLHRVTV